MTDALAGFSAVEKARVSRDAAELLLKSDRSRCAAALASLKDAAGLWVNRLGHYGRNDDLLDAMRRDLSFAIDALARELVHEKRMSDATRDALAELRQLISDRGPRDASEVLKLFSQQLDQLGSAISRRTTVRKGASSSLADDIARHRAERLGTSIGTQRQLMQSAGVHFGGGAK